jgi:ubiquitin-activating enzyme E1
MTETPDLALNKEFMDLYSRQIGAYGIETMGRLVNMKVVLVGLQGVGVEAAKNLTLAGPGSIVLCDDHPTEVSGDF